MGGRASLCEDKQRLSAAMQDFLARRYKLYVLNATVTSIMIEGARQIVAARWDVPKEMFPGAVDESISEKFSQERCRQGILGRAAITDL